MASEAPQILNHLLTNNVSLNMVTFLCKKFFCITLFHFFFNYTVIYKIVL